MGRNITKKEIINGISDRTKMTAQKVSQVVNMFLDEIVQGLASGDRFEFRDFGVFEVVERKPKQARNPRTGETVMIPPKKVVKFKNGRIMKEKISGNLTSVKKSEFKNSPDE